MRNNKVERRSGQDRRQQTDRRKKVQEAIEEKRFDDQIEGRNSVLELLESGKDINKIYVTRGEKHGSINKILGIAKERKIKFELTDESFLDFEHGIIDSYDLVTILGNLIENAFEACSLMENEEKEVEVSLYEDKNIIEIQVRDNGKEIQKDIKEFIFKEGVSSKGEGRGTGLFLVKSRVELYNGHIEIEEFNDEKIFVVIIYKGE